MAAADAMAQNQDLVQPERGSKNVQEKIQLAGANVQSDGMIQEPVNMSVLPEVSNGEWLQHWLQAPVPWYAGV
jgi:hypothetical protein